MHRKAGLLRQALREARGRTGAARSARRSIPLVVGTNEAALDLQAGLVAEGFDVRAVRPPTVPEGTARLRVTARYPVPDADLLRFAALAGRLWRPAGVTA